MNEEDLYRILLGQICSGMIASGRKDDNQMLDEAEAWAKVIMKENYFGSKEFEKRKFTGFLDAYGNRILEGDIFVYDEFLELNGQIPEDLISNYNKRYANTISLHPVFWDDDHGMWASDVYRDVDRLGSYRLSRLYVVSNKIEHPELYNH